MTWCKTCKWRDRCDLDCGDPQGFSYSPMSREEMEAEREDSDTNQNENTKEDN